MLEALPRGAHGMTVLRPLELRGAAVTLIVALQVALALLVGAPAVAQAPFPARAIRRQVIVEGIAALVVRLAQIILAPVGFFQRRIHTLGKATATPPVAGGRDQGAVLHDAPFGKNCHCALLFLLEQAEPQFVCRSIASDRSTRRWPGRQGRPPACR